MCPRCAGLPTTIPRQDQPAEVRAELLKTVLYHEHEQNADAGVMLLKFESLHDDAKLVGSIAVRIAVFDIMGALVLACKSFEGGDIAQKLRYLEVMKTLNEEDTAANLRLLRQIQSAEESEAACLARYGQTPIIVQGQRKTLIDLYATEPAELLAYFAQERYARWSSGYFPIRCPHPEELGDFPVAECLRCQPSRAEQLQQLGVCNMVLLRYAEACGQLNAALQLGLKTSMTYTYLATAYAALGEDSLRDLHMEAAARAEPDPNFVTIHHLYMDSVPDSVSATGQFAMVNKRQLSYATHVSGKC